ncbi:MULTISPECIES: GNAT family N-acetyltransferase [Streptomycetaceae]|uniref:GCN5-related N-acetyltransferase n=1 Tax=Streptantibioticus cattleyicolor (strain ATCC 35852 / DSM 46488 / JCM 4925 / NBRC 14057 / NRRL 8057) TaxID=1003195 RepID=F8JYR9_STREN|nr:MULTISPECIES: GNAT family N-acetyltransferase [Streptomycetaceae]AEW93907.1 GCN5-related N-acetyltransferase [Streptantibioticus cattleyicolor NRRL 8057 = DSM 46488]MYS58586.1 GNAT family N-acetyltransferase [Streptomyces sp. SID5468]CCB74254.1 Acetyltransferase, GNAT family [Streptantibioticus cattleyicolor NRRL 8057 = DSM 46488]
MSRPAPGPSARTAVVPVEEIFELRRAVLRPGRPPGSAVFAEDAEPATFHIAAYTPDGALAACVTFFPEPLPGEEGPAYRFRGMASAPELRGHGYGAAVLRAGLAEAAARGARIVWCNGRTSARGFYEHHGFAVGGDEFMIEGVGPHFLFTIKPL